MTQPETLKTAEELGAALSAKHLEFADEYLSNGLNARAAGRAVKYKNPAEGPRLLRRPDVRAYVKASLDEQSYSVAHIKRRLEYLSEADMRDFARIAPSERSYWIRADQHEEVREYAKRRGITPDAVDNMDPEAAIGILLTNATAQGHLDAGTEIPDGDIEYIVGVEVLPAIVPA